MQGDSSDDRRKIMMENLMKINQQITGFSIYGMSSPAEPLKEFEKQANGITNSAYILSIKPKPNRFTFEDEEQQMFSKEFNQYIPSIKSSILDTPPTGRLQASTGSIEYCNKQQKLSPSKQCHRIEENPKKSYSPQKINNDRHLTENKKRELLKLKEKRDILKKPHQITKKSTSINKRLRESSNSKSKPADWKAYKEKADILQSLKICKGLASGSGLAKSQQLLVQAVPISSRFNDLKTQQVQVKLKETESRSREKLAKKEHQTIESKSQAKLLTSQVLNITKPEISGKNPLPFMTQSDGFKQFAKIGNPILLGQRAPIPRKFDLTSYIKYNKKSVKDR